MCGIVCQAENSTVTAVNSDSAIGVFCDLGTNDSVRSRPGQPPERPSLL